MSFMGGGSVYGSHVFHVGGFCLWTTSCGCQTEWGGGGRRLEVGSSRHIISLCTCVHMSFHPIGWLLFGWSDGSWSRDIPLPPSCLLPEKLTELRKGRKAALLWILREGRKRCWVEIGRLGSLGGIWQRMQGFSCWKPGFGRGSCGKAYLSDSTCRILW